MTSPSHLTNPSPAALAPFAAALLLLLLPQGCRTAPTEGSGLTTLRTERRSGLYTSGRQQVMVLRGSPYQMGLDHGRLLPDAVRTVVRESLLWTHAAGLDRAMLKAMHEQLWPHVPEPFRAEMRGLAAGSGVPLGDLQLLHAMPSEFHCSGAAAAGPATRDGKLYHSRSLDYSLGIGVDDRLQNHALLIVRVPSDGIANAVPAWAGFLGAVTGLNLAGISIGEKGSASRDESLAGMPMIFTVRQVLRRASTLAQAVEVVRRGPRTCGFNYIVGSGDERQAVALEVTRHEFFVAGFGDDHESVPPHETLPFMVRRTNHFVGRDTAATQRRPGQGYHPEAYMAGSWRRYQAITAFLRQHSGALDAPRMIELLRQYPAGHPCLHQVVMGSSDRLIWVSQAVDDRRSPTAGAQNQPFVRYDLRAIVDR